MLCRNSDTICMKQFRVRYIIYNLRIPIFISSFHEQILDYGSYLVDMKYF